MNYSPEQCMKEQEYQVFFLSLGHTTIFHKIKNKLENSKLIIIIEHPLILKQDKKKQKTVTVQINYIITL